ncbi:MAG: IS1182 family transposase [Cytophagales bacterium]|nr:IS1182 family transposase [Cytophagales bacterium]
MKRSIDFHFLYKLTESYYGKCGQKSIDPVVFYKICLVGYLENIISDRQLIEHCSMRLDILFFLDYNIDEELPWHSTISRTRQLFPEPVFEEVFNKIFTLCVDKGMVAGHTQAIDSAMIKANASMESLELKVPEESLEDHLKKVRILSQADRPVKTNKASGNQQTITASKEEIRDLRTTQEKWRKDQNQHPGASSKKSKYTSNKTHYSPTDPDARVSVKPVKARKLNFFSQMAVDSAHHVITHIHADYADKADNQCLASIVYPLKSRLQNNGLDWKNLATDAGYSSGENLAFLERKGIDSHIPPHGTYKGGPEGFTYHQEGDYWECAEGKRVTFRKIGFNKGNKQKHYFTRRGDCKGCPIKTACLGKSKEKKIAITYYMAEYERAIVRSKTRMGRKMKALRQSTVEPVFGTLIEHLGMRKMNTIGIRQANKNMLLAAMAYNLKKYLKFDRKMLESMAKDAGNLCFELFQDIWRILSLFERMENSSTSSRLQF